MADLAVALLGPARRAAALAERTGLEVRACGLDDHGATVDDLQQRASLVVGLAADPWPVGTEVHARRAEADPAYRGVVSWHRLPALHQWLADAAAPAVRAGAHLLITAPDPGAEAEPEEVTFLREVAEALAARLQPSSRSIAWTGDTRTPTAVDALRTVVEAHERRDVVECPVAPWRGADPALRQLAEELGIRLVGVDLGERTHLDLLAEAVATVRAHELDAQDPG